MNPGSSRDFLFWNQFEKMVTTIFIDGYNVLRKIPRFHRLFRSNGDAARRGFVEYLRTHSDEKLVVVFDGHGEEIGGAQKLKVLFSGPRTADSWIRREIESLSQPASCHVVSSDHEVLNHARAMGVAATTAEEFLSGLENNAFDHQESEKPRSDVMTRSEIERWKREFGWE